MTSPLPLSVAIFEDDQKICTELRDLLDGTPGFRCVLAALSVRNVVQRVEKVDPSVVILDIRFPTGSGLSALAELKKARPEQRVLMHTVVDSGDDILLAYLLGASGLLLKGDGRSRILAAIEVVADGGAIFSPRIAWVFRQMSLGTNQTEWVLELTSAELDVLNLLSQGMTAREIAVVRGTTVGTINNQCEAIRKKAGMKKMGRVISQVAPWSRILRTFSTLWHSGGAKPSPKA